MSRGKMGRMPHEWTVENGRQEMDRFDGRMGMKLAG